MVVTVKLQEDKYKAIETRIANSYEEIREYDEELSVEEGPLMRRSASFGCNIV